MSLSAAPLAAAGVLLALTALCSCQCPTTKVSRWARQELLQSQLQFSADLLQSAGELQSDGNLFLSPSSVFSALLLAYFAAANQTEESLKAALRFPDKMDKSDILGAYSWEKTKQNNRAVEGSGKYKLSSVNKMYISDKEKVLPCIEKILKNEIVIADLTTNVSSTIEKINKFVSDSTSKEINDFLSPDSLNENTNLVLVNAAYFRGLWTYPFSPSETKSSQFILANGSTVDVIMMSQENKFNHWFEEDIGVEVVELPYKEANISMFILLPLTPSPTAISELINKTSSDKLLEIFSFANETSDEVTVSIPKFMVDQTLDLTPVGTTAAAATAIFANRFAADVFSANHPFVYFIFDKKANTILFAGIFNSPET